MNTTAILRVPRVVGRSDSSSASASAPYKYALSSNGSPQRGSPRTPRTPRRRRGTAASSPAGSPSVAINGFQQAMEMAMGFNTTTDTNTTRSYDDDDYSYDDDSDYASTMDYTETAGAGRGGGRGGGGGGADQQGANPIIALNQNQQNRRANDHRGGGQRSTDRDAPEDESIAERILRHEREDQHNLIDRAKACARKLMREADKVEARLQESGEDIEESLEANLSKLEGNFAKRTAAIKSSTDNLEAYRRAQASHNPDIFFGDNVSLVAAEEQQQLHHQHQQGLLNGMTARTMLTATATERAMMQVQLQEAVAAFIRTDVLFPALDRALQESDARRGEREEQQRIEALDQRLADETQARAMSRARHLAAKRNWQLAAECAREGYVRSLDPQLSEIRRAAAQRRREAEKREEAEQKQQLTDEEEKLHRLMLKMDPVYRAEWEKREREKRLAPKDLAQIRAELAAAESEWQALERKEKEREEEQQREAASAQAELKRQLEEEAEAEEKAKRVQARIDSAYESAAAAGRSAYGLPKVRSFGAGQSISSMSLSAGASRSVYPQEGAFSASPSSISLSASRTCFPTGDVLG